MEIEHNCNLRATTKMLHQRRSDIRVPFGVPLYGYIMEHVMTNKMASKKISKWYISRIGRF